MPSSSSTSQSHPPRNRGNNRRNRNRIRRNYDRASTADDDDDYNNDVNNNNGDNGDNANDQLLDHFDENPENENENDINCNNNNNSDDIGADTDTDINSISINILDSAQNKFNISNISPDSWTVQRLKEEGASIHKVPPDQQRLIYMGRLLQDDTTLREAKIDSSGVIVHLFPKPTIIVHNAAAAAAAAGDNNATTTSSTTASTSNDENTDNNNNNNNSNNSNSNNNLAHIPQIVVDAEEAQRSSNILVLSSHEAFEILHRVRLCSFCLLVYSIMDILQDFTLWFNAMYVNDPNGNNYNNGNGSSSSDDQDDFYGIVPGDPIDTTIPNAPYDPFTNNGGGVYDANNADSWSSPTDVSNNINNNDSSSAPPGYGNNDPNYEQQLQWDNIYYIDLLLSFYALYVAMYGIKVTTDHSRHTARIFTYMVCTLAFMWNALSYFLVVRTLEKMKDWGDTMNLTDDANDDFNHNDNSNNDSTNNNASLDDDNLETSVYVLAFWDQSFLFFLWSMFLFWVFQFKKLIEEADVEAEERTRSLTGAAVGVDVDTSAGAAVGAYDAGGITVPSTETSTTGRSNYNNNNSGSTDYDLELQMEGHSIS